MDCIHLSRDKRNWWTVVDIVMNIRFFKIRGKGGVEKEFSLAEKLLPFQETLRFTI
jgi:hypothetical protein